MTVLCPSQSTDLPCQTSAHLVDTDTGEIRKLADLDRHLVGISISYTPRSVKISPDGKMLAVGTMDGVDIYSMDGKIIRDDILPYTIKTTTRILPSLYWLPDSSGLIIAIPDRIYTTIAHGDFPAHTIWRYTIDSNTMVRTSVEPPPWLFAFEVSPDGNWVAYGGYSDPLLYLGNLVNGDTQIFGMNSSHPSFFWSPDSKYLWIRWGGAITSFDKPPVYIAGNVNQWIDANHLISDNEKSLIAEIRGDEIVYYDSGFSHPSVIVVIRPK